MQSMRIKKYLMLIKDALKSTLTITNISDKIALETYCGLWYIEHMIGTTDRRLARLNDYDKNSRLTLAEQGDYFVLDIAASQTKALTKRVRVPIIRAN